MGKSYEHRTESPLNVNLSKRLLIYATAASAAGVGALALAGPAEAKIVYTRVNQSVVNGTLLDLNNDGIPDFKFCTSSQSNSHPCSSTDRVGRGLGRTRRAFATFQALLVLPAMAGNETNRIWGSSFRFAYALPAGVPADSKLNFPPYKKVMAECEASESHSRTCGGPWFNASHRYLSLKFVISGKIHYGWARLNDSGWGSATLTGYAYETIPNKSIITGDIVGPSKRKNVSRKTPEPDGVREVPTTSRATASLGLLARGAQGLVAWRRKDESE